MSNATEIRQAAAQTIDTFIAAVRGGGVTVSNEAVEFIKDNPAFLSMPAMRVACRAPSFINIFDPVNNAGGFDMNKAFEECLIAEMVALGDDEITAKIHVSHASGVARAIVRKLVSTDQQYVLMDGYNEVPSSVKVTNDINFPAHRSV